MANKKLKNITKKRLKGNRYKSRYQVGGMYGDNTVASAGQGRPGATANIVYQESDPKLQEQRIAGQKVEEEQLVQDISESTAEAKALKEQEEIDIANAAAESQQKSAMTSSIIQTGLEGGKSLGLLKEGKSAGSSVKDAITAYKATRAAKQAAQGFQAAKTTMAGVKTAQNLKTGFDVAKSSANVANIAKTGIQTGQTVQGLNLAKTATTTGSALGSAASTGSAVGSGLSALNTVNVYSAAANYAGKGIKSLSDDDDATTWTAGEASGDVLSKAGEYAGYGAMLGSVVPGVGNAVGGIVGGIAGIGAGLYQGFAGRKKAREAEAEAQRKQLAFKTKTDIETKERFGSQLARVKAGQLKQKTYSGYDLGRNVSAQMGGMRMGTPRYGYAA